MNTSDKDFDPNDRKLLASEVEDESEAEEATLSEEEELTFEAD